MPPSGDPCTGWSVGAHESGCGSVTVPLVGLSTVIVSSACPPPFMARVDGAAVHSRTDGGSDGGIVAGGAVAAVAGGDTASDDTGVEGLVTGVVG